MVNATVDNGPVAITLSDGQSTTVPSNETWKVTITCEAASISDDHDILINGTKVAGGSAYKRFERRDELGFANATSTVPFDTVLTGGETISVNGGGMRIGGFVVNQ